MTQNDTRLALILAAISVALMVLEPKLPPFMRQAHRLLTTVIGLWMVFVLYILVFRLLARAT